MRTIYDRIRYVIGFEVIGILLYMVFAQLFVNAETKDLGTLAVLLAVIAVGWNFIFNYYFDIAMMKLKGTTQKTHFDRVVHSLLFEGGLLLCAIAAILYFLKLSMMQSVILGISGSIFYMVYNYFYSWGYDVVFPIPEKVMVSNG